MQTLSTLAQIASLALKSGEPFWTVSTSAGALLLCESCLLLFFCSEGACNPRHASCPAYAGAARAKVLYSPSELWSLPNVVTLAGIRRAIPLPSVLSDGESGLAEILQELPVAFDAHGMWQDAEQATQWALDNIHGLCNSTASLVVLQVKVCSESCPAVINILNSAPMAHMRLLHSVRG